MKRVPWLLGGVVLLSVAAWTLAQGKMEGANAGGTDKKPNPRADALAKLGLGLQLAAYGEHEKDPLALLTAARLIKQAPAEDGKREKIVQGEPSESDKPKPLGASPVSAADLIKKALELAGDDATIKALAKTIEAEKPRGATRGAIRHRDQVRGRTIDTYTVEFRGGEVARVGLEGDHSSDLDLYVYDQNGNLIVSDTDDTDLCLVQWTPRWTGPFQIKIVNNGQVSNVYDLYSN
jgi:hypothetical protein